MSNSLDRYTPQLRAKAFHCPHCGVVAQMHWTELAAVAEKSERRSDFMQAVCTSCYNPTLWVTRWETDGMGRLSGQMAWPISTVQAPNAHVDLPADCASDFEEARQVAAISPRASAALLRLCVQKLCVHLGGTGDNINADIGALVKSGLPVEIKEALDVARVVGNNAVHPGEMSSADTSEIVESLFGLLNFIVDRMITQPKAIARLHSKLPPGALQAIQKRDGQPTT